MRKDTMNRIIGAAAAAAALALPASAGAHVTVQPKEVPSGAFTVIDVRVPNESDSADTTKVQVQMPDGFISASYQVVPGWKVVVKKEKLTKPIKLEGTEIDEQVSEITFSGGKIAPGQFQDFPLSVKIPEGAAGSQLTFKALQTYSDGEVARWIGAEDSDKPAPTVTLTAPSGEHAAAPAATPAAAKADSASASDGNGNGLAIAALIVGTLGLIAGVGALATARRARTAAV
jgi:uncharacterized protein YcnI